MLLFYFFDNVISSAKKKKKRKIFILVYYQRYLWSSSTNSTKPNTVSLLQLLPYHNDGPANSMDILGSFFLEHPLLDSKHYNKYLSLFLAGRYTQVLNVLKKIMQTWIEFQHFWSSCICVQTLMNSCTTVMNRCKAPGLSQVIPSDARSIVCLFSVNANLLQYLLQVLPPFWTPEKMNEFKLF